MLSNLFSMKFLAFRGNFDWNDISLIFRHNFAAPIVSIRMIFRTLIRSSRKFIMNLRTIIHYSQKCAANFQAVIHYSRKFVANFQVYIHSVYHLRFHYKSSIDYMYVNILSVKWALQLLSFASQPGSAVAPNSPPYCRINAVIPAPESIKVAANLL